MCGIVRVERGGRGEVSVKYLPTILVSREREIVQYARAEEGWRVGTPPSSRWSSSSVGVLHGDGLGEQGILGAG